MFILNKEISFNEEDGHLENKGAEVSLLMTASTRRLFSVLISNQGNPVERDCLFKTVWDDNGMRSSNSNLNQYISILRKQLIQVGLPDNAIITIPRVGFMFNPEIEVRREISVAAGKLSRPARVLQQFIASQLYYPVFTLFIFLVCAGVFFIFFYDREPGMITLARVAGYPPECSVYALPGVGMVNRTEAVPLVAENCDERSVYYIFKRSGPPEDWLIVSCEKSTPGYFSLCHNQRKGTG